jgi:hypothetical protein
MPSTRPDPGKSRKRSGSKRSGSPTPRTAPESDAPQDTAAPDVQPADASALESLGAAISQPVRDAADGDVDRRSSTPQDPPDERLQ